MLKYLKVPQDNQTMETISLLLEESLTLILNIVPVEEFLPYGIEE